MKKLTAIFGWVLIVAAPAAQAAEPGTTALAFLKLTTGARPLAMGEAFTGVADDVNAVYTNPAGLGLFGGKQAQLTHHQHFQQITHEVVTYAHDFEGLGHFGVNLAFLFVSNMTKTFATPTGDFDREGGTFSARDMAITLAYGRQLVLPGLNIGASAKVLNETIDNSGAFTFAIDLGAHYRTVVKGLTLGLVAQNVGAPIQQDPLPMMVKAGVGYRIEAGAKEGEMRDSGGVVVDHAIQFAGDVSIPVDNTPTMSAGAEYLWKGMIAVRGGFRAGPNLRDLGAGSGPTGGLGFRFKMVGLDFGYQGYGELGPTFRVSLGVRL